MAIIVVVGIVTVLLTTTNIRSMVSSSSLVGDSTVDDTPVTQLGNLHRNLEQHRQGPGTGGYPSYQLAKDQSFGFFTDILDDHWKQLQQIHSKTFPNYLESSQLAKHSNLLEDKGDYKKLKNSNWWNGENFQVEFHCPMAQRVPPTSEADGPKWVCDPHRLAARAKYETDGVGPPSQSSSSPSSSCLIYSFGSNGKAEFEHGMRDVLGPDSPCEIHTFDMVTSNKRNGDFAEALEGAASFHPWGLGTPEQARGNPRSFKTLEETMQALGHVNRTIDIFKIDCEWCEWYTYSQWLQQDIRQILVETHNAPMPRARDFFWDLHDAGYVIFSKEANYQNQAGAVEFAFLKLSTSFFVNGTLYYERTTNYE